MIQHLLLVLLCVVVARYQVDKNGVTGKELPGYAFSALGVCSFDTFLPPDLDYDPPQPGARGLDLAVYLPAVRLQAGYFHSSIKQE